MPKLRRPGSDKPADDTALKPDISGPVRKLQQKILRMGEEIARRSQIEQALRESEEKYRLLFESVTEAIVVVQDGIIKFLNPSAVELLGYRRKEIVNSSISKFIHPGDLEVRQENYRRRIAGEQVLDKPIFRMIAKDGSIRWAHINAVAIKWEDKPATLNFITDVTERQLYEDSLRKSEEQYRLLAEHTADTVWLMDMNLKPFYQSPSVEKLRGFTRKEIEELPLEKSLTPESLKVAAELFLTELPKLQADPDYNPVYTVDLEYYCKDGTTTWAENNFSIIRDGNGKPVSILGEGRDITKRRRAEEATKESERLLAQSQEMAHVGSWVLDVITNRLSWSDETCRIFGLEPQEFGASYEAFLDTVHPEDRAAVDSAYSQSLRDGRDSYEIEHRIVRKYTGEIRTVYEKCINERDMAGVIVRSIGMVQDITERRKAEQTLRQSEEKYHLLADHITDAIYMFDMNLNITYVSPTVKSRGYSEQEIGELPLEQQVTQSSLDIIYRLIREEFPRVNAFPGYNPVHTVELEIYRKDGGTIWTENKISLIRDPAGKPASILVEARDITERKRAEDELHRALSITSATLDGTIRAIALMSELRDPYTAGHQRMVTDLAIAIAEELNLPADKIKALQVAGILHDVGKMYVPAEILSKPGRLTRLEMEMVRTHAESGYEIISAIAFPWPVANIVRQHHERLDGSGYPLGLRSDEILVEARILAVADVIEATISHRPYRPGHGLEIALEDIVRGRGILYDEQAVDACVRLFKEKGFKFS